MKVDETYRKGLKLILDIVHKRIIKELTDQGHIMTGKIVKDYEQIIDVRNSEVHLKGKYQTYAKYLHTGVHSSRIPYDPTVRTGKKHSRYIEALIKYAKFRGMTNPKSAAFAIATVHSREGMSTKASKKFSRTGQRQNFIDIVFFDNKINNSIVQVLDEKMFILFDNMITRQQKQIQKTES